MGSTATLVIDYFLQLSVIQPSLLLGETDGVALLSQFNAHGIFIALEEIGFFMMSLSMLVQKPFGTLTPSRNGVPVRAALYASLRGCFARARRPSGGQALRRLFQERFRSLQETFARLSFDVLHQELNWLTLIPSGILLSIIFRRALTASSQAKKVNLTTKSARA